MQTFQSELTAEKIKYRARLYSKNQILLGNLTRQPCEICGVEPAECHHINYYNPNRIRWLCRKHHKQHHTQIRKRLTHSKLMKKISDFRQQFSDDWVRLPAEPSELCGLSSSTILELVVQGDVKSAVIGKTRLIFLPSLLAYLEAHVEEHQK